MPCEDKTCQEMVYKHEETLHGNGGVVERLGKKVSQTGLGWAIVTVGLPVAAGLLYMYATVSGIREVYASKERVAEISQETALNAERYQHLRELIEELRDLMEDIQEDIDNSGG